MTRQPATGKKDYKAAFVSAGDGVSYIWAGDQLAAAGNKYGDMNVYYPLIMDLANVPKAHQAIAVRGVACAAEHAVLWDLDGQAYSWGKAKFGKLGHPNPIGEFKDSDVEVQPRRILALENRKVVQAALGRTFSLFLDKQGALASIGMMRPLRSSTESDFQLLSPVDLRAFAKNELLKQTQFVKVSCGDEHCLAADAQGRLYSWGLNFQDCLGAKADSLKEPTVLDALAQFGVGPAHQVVDFCCGPDYSVAIVDAAGTDPDEEIYTSFRYSNVDNVKHKLLKLAVKTKQVLEAHSTDAVQRSKPSKIANLNNELLRQMVAQYLDKTELNGFASLREDSKKAVLQDMIKRFLREELSIEDYSAEFVKLNELCAEMGVDFEQTFYDQVMQDPAVRREDQQSLARANHVPPP